ncbi:MAG: hypothetical protein HFF62_08605, partial [Oscillospiraceae bacterium]|nr:hypothetical protein [Oscillospiraceae bacterium]
YELGPVNLGSYYDSGAMIDGQTLTLPIKAVESDEEIGIGTITVIIHTQNFEDMTATINVRSENKIIPTDVSLNKTSMTLTVGGSERLTATVAPDNATNKAVTWASSNTAVVTVDASGNVTAVSVGKATITATTVDGGKTASCTVTVKQNTPPPPARYTVTVEAGPGGRVSGGGTYTRGTPVTVKAIADSGYHFVRWTENGKEVDANASYTFTVTGRRTLTAVFEKDEDPTPPAPDKYTVTAEAGPGGRVTGSGTYEENASVTVTATPESGYHFVEWTEDGSAVSTEESYTFTVTGDRTLTAVFEKDEDPTPPEPVQFTVTVEAGPGGTVSGGGTYEENATVTVTATPESGYHFVRWTENGGKVSGEIRYTFTVTSDRTLTAVFERNSSSGGGSGGSSGGGSSGGGSSSGGPAAGGGATVVERPDPARPGIPTVSQTKPVTPDKNGNVTISNGAVQSAINTAKNDAKKNGNTANGVAVVIPIAPGAGQDAFNVAIQAQTLNTLVRENVKRLEMDIQGVLVETMDAGLLQWLDTALANGDIILRVTPPSGLSQAARAAIGTRPVYDLSLVHLSGGKETPITDLGGRTIAVRLPYAPAKEEQTENLYAVYVDGKGQVEWLTKSSYDPDLGAVVFETGHFSIYGIGYKNPVPAFTDIQNHWAEDNIIFAASRGLLTGTGNNQFSPDTGMTRGMFVTALGRLAGIEPDSYKTGKFTDVKADAYYVPYVNWAAEKGIVNGTASTAFSPDTNITREQMAVIMAGYAKQLGYDLPAAHDAVTFADNAQISGWAAKEVKAMQQAGIMAGKGGSRFDPKGTATRAEVATVLRRFVEIVIDPQTAQGWMQNHSGSWQYMKK